MASEDDTINILILGETGVGKSTFINSFYNYMQYSSLEEAEQSPLLQIIPTKVTIADENYVDRNINIGTDENEDKVFGNSSTQGAKSYVFDLCGKKKYKVRLIDTPGIGDTRGVCQDEENCTNILNFISRFDKLHAICFLLKPDQTVISVYFNYCIINMLAQLGKSAKDNIVFCFTNSRCTFYKPGSSVTMLKRILDDIYKESGVKIPLSDNNTFFMDNEAFKYLTAIKSNIKIGGREKSVYKESWNYSYKVVWDFIEYVAGGENRKGLTPHCTAETLSINTTRKIIMDLSKPLADISDLIEDNIVAISTHTCDISKQNLTIQELQQNLYVPVINLEQTPLKRPTTICTAEKCSEIYVIKGIKKYHYKSRCHEPCYLDKVPVEINGARELINCSAMAGTQNCTICGCNFQTHMHVQYTTNTYEDKMEDDSVRRMILSKEEGNKVRHGLIQKMNIQLKEFEIEREEIKTIMAKFAVFLKENSITTYSDAYVEYLDYLIDREKKLGPKGDKQLLIRYTSMKKEYLLKKDVVEKAVKTLSPKGELESKSIKPEDISKMVQQLYRLKHTGKQIQKMYEFQKNGRKLEHNKITTESVYKAVINKFFKSKQKKTKQTAVENLCKNYQKLSVSKETGQKDLLEYLCSMTNLDKNKGCKSVSECAFKEKDGEASVGNKEKHDESGAELKGKLKEKDGKASAKNKGKGKEMDEKPKNNEKGKGKPGNSDNNDDVKRNLNRNESSDNCGGSRKNFNKSGQGNKQFRDNQIPDGKPNNSKQFCNDQFGNQLNQFGNFPNLYGNNSNLLANFLYQLGNNQLGYPPNQFGNQPNQFGNQPNQFGNQPNQFGNQPNQFGSQPNQFGNQLNQFGNQPNQFGNQPNQFGNQPNQFGNQPNQFGNQPNQFGNQPNPFGNQSYQLGNQPNHFGNQPNQFGNQPNQFGNQPNQFGNQPNQFGNQPNQFGNQPNQFGSRPNQFGNQPNHNRHSNSHSRNSGYNSNSDNFNSPRRNNNLFKKKNVRKNSESKSCNNNEDSSD